MLGGHHTAEEFVNLPNFTALARVIEAGQPVYKKIKSPPPVK